MSAVTATSPERPHGARRSRRSLLLCVLCGSALVHVSAQAPPDRSRPPALAQTPQLDLPSIQKRALSNGVPVWLVESHEVPIVQVNVVVRAGAGDDPVGKFGTASLTSAMLDEGAGTRSALELADAVEFLGASLTPTSSFDSSAVRLNVPVERLRDALPLLADVTLRPTLPAKELERLRQERLTSFLQARDDPASIAPMAFSRIVFGGMHRYGTGMVGTEASLKRLSTADLSAFHATYYQPAHAVLVVVGDATPDTILPDLERHFGSWKNSGPPARGVAISTAPQVSGRQIYLVDKPGAEQSQIRIGWVGVPRSTPDYFPLLVLNTILGGSFTSRLNQNLREEHGYAYGASSGFDMRLSAGPFVAAAGVQTDKTAESVREFFNELTAMVEPIGADEIAKAKNYIALGFPAEFESSGDLSRRLEELILYQLPDDYFERYIANVQAVTAAAVQNAAKTYIQPSHSAVVIVGDRRTIESGIRALNLGPVRVMSVDEELGM
jgi:zinc protease